MLNDIQRETIRNIVLYEYGFQEENGKPMTFNNEEFTLLSFEELKQWAFNEILKHGFSKIERVAPGKANCIIRVFQILHYEHEDDIYNVHGVECYTKKCGRWFSVGNTGDFEINHSKCIIKHWLAPDDYILFEANFFDCYVEIS